MNDLQQLENALKVVAVLAEAIAPWRGQD